MSEVTPSQQRGYDAVYEVIRKHNTDARANAIIWQAVEAYRHAAADEVL